MSDMNFGLRDLLVRSLISWADKHLEIHSLLGRDDRENGIVSIEPVFSTELGCNLVEFPVWTTDQESINRLGSRLNEGFDLEGYEGSYLCYALLTTREGREADRAGEFDLQWVEQAVMSMSCDDLGGSNE
jgi:hypothetical protein